LNPKNLGNIFERKIAKKLSLALTDGKQDHACYRSHSSGAIYTVNKNISDKFEGDIYQVIDKGVYETLDKFFNKFVVETKYRTDLELRPPFNKKVLDIIDDINKKYDNKEVLLVFGNKGKKALFFIKDKINNDFDVVLNIKERNLILYGYTEETFLGMIGNFL
jgi:hypothetical protein